jgi:hypothetical protein
MTPGAYIAYSLVACRRVQSCHGMAKALSKVASDDSNKGVRGWQHDGMICRNIARPLYGQETAECEDSDSCNTTVGLRDE